MKSAPFVIKAGPRALAKIREQGIAPDQFRVMVGASGGPKWFILSGLDRYLAGEFFRGRRTPLYLLGSSVGGWRMAAHASMDPADAVRRFRDHYHHLRYPPKASAQVVSQSSRDMIEVLLGSGGADAVCRNGVFKLHLITAGCRPLAQSEQRALQLSGLLLAAGVNVLNRRWLSGFYHRSLFHVADSEAPFLDLVDYPTERVSLTPANLPKALEATGAIPLVLEGVRDIEGSRHPVHRDGGIVDYHFDIPFAPGGEDLVLYPHFYDRTIPGWFDKGLSWRRPRPAHYENVVLIAPSPALVAQLPHGKISDRKDFTQYDDATRIRNWQRVIDASERLAEAFAERVERQQWDDVLSAI